MLDSGAGGLTIFNEINRIMPRLPVIYCADNEGFPYGPRPQEEVIQRVSLCLRTLCEQFQPSLAVIACNTASTVALSRVREELPIPVVGVVPAIKTAANLSENQCIGLLATPGTVQRQYTDDLIHDFASQCKVIRVGTTELVQIAENKLKGIAPDLEKIKSIISPFLEAEKIPDQAVLGCTHFPLLKEELNLCAPEINWVDSGEAIARRVLSLLENQLNGDSPALLHKALFTDPLTSQEAPYDSALKSMGFHSVDTLDLPGFR
nr:glutamate racemase [Sansalvadorimonas sp. 2012CJ34-2]